MADETPSTISAPAADTTPSGTSNANAGIEPASQQTPSAPGNQAAPGEESLPPLDLKGIPKELQPRIKAAYDKINNDFRSNYTKKYQTLAEEKKAWTEKEKTWTQKEQQYAALQTQIREALLDERKYQEYRQRLGIPTTQQPAQAPEEIKPPQTVGDLLDLVEKRVVARMDGLKQYTDQRTNQSIDQYDRQGRWNQAERAVSQDPVFQRYQTTLTAMALNDPKYRQMYTGFNEAQVISSVLEDFKALRNKDLEETRQQTLKDLETKKGRSTLPPSTASSTSMAPGKTGPKSQADMIAAAKAKIGW